MSLKLAENVKWLAIQYQRTNIESLMGRIGEIVEVLQGLPLSLYVLLYSINTATGVWLDYVGYRLGVFDRPSFPADDDYYFGFDSSGGTGFDQANFYPMSSDTVPFNDTLYRAFLKAKAQQLITDCTPENIRSSLLLFFNSVLVDDNQDMSIDITIITVLPLPIVQAALDAGIITKPAAVLVNTTVVESGYFGFAGSGGTGFDQDSFIYQD